MIAMPRPSRNRKRGESVRPVVDVRTTSMTHPLTRRSIPDRPTRTENRARGRTRRWLLHRALQIASWIARACGAVIADVVAALLTL
jgi:hypothetical protein